ncbi:P-loop NTPase fold protein [Mucilaginibacter sp.]|jgi:hypothetical protein|uniref:P-loop NTPase fold protein n=1 Tax=Mucilaginibacter sp. TaxID=1882438 RepID=UPI002CADFC58|nr:P-loop NTPase fold protein [Mucilaginibacter sp.]HTI57674.1 P-loop NTPase fold protein [Mucilaginibacter sp.]
MSQPKFISDQPRGEDMFEGKAQEKISFSIIELINDKDSENRLLGLDGAWGSGKSNVITIIQDKLKNTHHIYIHDAWGHQEDLQRRTFLEELTEDLCSNNLIDKKTWEGNLKNLLSKKRETVTKTIPKLSPGIIVAILVTVLTPIAKAMSETVQRQITKLLITAIPLIIAFIIWIIFSIVRRKPIALAEMFYLYKEKELENKTHVTVSESEPSVREFKKWMHDLSQSLIEKKLIIVFDNMDRLPADKVQTLWSSIHTFFSEHYFDKISVIIPFDREHIRETFKLGADKDENINQFINKTFSVVFRVAPLVLTDWQRFFNLKYKEAFAEDENDEYQITENTFDLMQTKITPRNIIAFINELVSIKRIVGKDILMRYIAVFVLAKEKILFNPINQILSLEFLGGASNLFNDDKELPDNIAALTYNVPLESARQVTLTREILISLRENDHNRLSKLSAHPYFIDVLEQIIHKESFDAGNAALAIKSLTIDSKEKPYIVSKFNYIWNRLGELDQKTPMSEQKISEGQKIILENISNTKIKQFLENLVTKIQDSPNFSGKNYFTALDDVDKFITSQNLKIDILLFLKEKKVSPEIFIDYLRVSRNSYARYKLTTDQNLLNDYLKKSLPTEIPVISELAFIKNAYDFIAVIHELDNIISSGQVTLINMAELYSLYKIVVSESKLIKLLDDSAITSLLMAATPMSEVYFDLVAMRLARGNSFPVTLGITSTVIESTDENQINEIAKRIEYFIIYGDLLLLVESFDKPLLKSVLNKLTKKSIRTSRLSIEKILPKFEAIRTLIDVTPYEFLDRLNGWADSAKKVINTQNIKDIVPDIKFYEYAIKQNNKLANFIVEEIGNYLNTVPIVDWTAAFHDESSFLFNITFLLLQASKLNSPPDNAITSYKEILKEIAKGTYVITKENVWSAYYISIKKNVLKPTIKNIRDIFLTDTNITAESFKYFSEMLLSYGELEKRASDVTRRILTPVANDDISLAFIINHGDFFAPIIVESGDDAIDFKDIIRRKIAANENIENINEFANAIKLYDTDPGEENSALGSQ